MLRRTMSVTVNVPVHRAFAYLVDFQRWPEWLSGNIESVERTSEGPVGVGSTFTSRRVVWGREGKYVATTKLEVTEYVPNRRLAWESKKPGWTEQNFIELEPANGGSRITKGHRDHIRSLWWLPILPLTYTITLLAWPFIRWAESRELRRLKERVESEL